ncbi:MAG: class I SAM-dependent methyltransferase [Burkholderiaceae bacterium]
MDTPVIDFSAVKGKQQQAWTAGNYAVVGTTLQIVGESICEAVDLRSHERVLDVAAGNGNASLAAARRWCNVVSTDYVAALLDQARVRAGAEGLAIDFQTADAENLPFADGSFDVVLSTFGVMFTPDQARAASELARVCKPGGKIGLASWTPTSMIGELFKLIGQYLPPAAGVRSPALWGTESHLAELFDTRAQHIRATVKPFVFRYRSSAHWLEVFRTYYGPMLKAFAALPEDKKQALEADVLALARRHNRADAGSFVAPSDYLEAVITIQ